MQKNPADPPTLQFMLPEHALPANAEVAVLLGLHQVLGGPFKLVYVFRRLKCVHVYECLSHGREYWYCLHLTTDHRFTLREMQPSSADRMSQYPDWWIRGSGAGYPAPLAGALYSDLEAKATESVLIIREQQHPLNLSGGKEVLVPPRYLYGVVPQALLDAYTFWKDESKAPRGTSMLGFPIASRGYKRLRG